MVDISALLPLSVGSIIALLVNSLIVTAVLLATEKILAHEMTLKNSLIMAIVSFLVVPVVLSFVGFNIPFIGIIIPLIVWIILGEFLLKGDKISKLKAIVAAFAVYLLLTFLGITSAIAGLLPF